ncbi:MAG TPA: hypothetical protein VFS21_31570, partial [Roseiflexaceae bacterium]|nr:hypothetical protein [Roseiflexaceae bacterium]
MNRITISISAITIALLFLAGCASSSTANDTSTLERREIAVQWVDDFSDERKVAGYSTNVFVGKVIRLIKTEQSPSPVSYFEVAVEETLKGKPLKTATIRQEGGVVNENGKSVLYVVEGDTELLAIGKTYIFASRPDQARGYLSLVGHSNQGYIQTKDLLDKQAKVAKFRAAIK